MNRFGVDAVATVLTAAILTVVDLDTELGTESAGLLVGAGSTRRLVEVKSAGGRAGEHLVDSLGKHLETWPGLKPGLPITGGTLIVNHQRSLPRTSEPRRSTSARRSPKRCRIRCSRLVSCSTCDARRTGRPCAGQCSARSTAPQPTERPDRA